MAELGTTIIIKKIKKGGEGHHGGAWKVAYADFVTAMMAFFLLLWLLSSTSKAQKEGIADYFSPAQEKTGSSDKDGAAIYFTPTFGMKDSEGIGVQGGSSPTEDGVRKSDKTPPGLVIGQVPQGVAPETPKKTMVEADQDANLFEKAQEEIKKAFEEDPSLRAFKDNIIVEQTPEGLRIQLIDDGKSPMFMPGGAELTEFGRLVLTRITGIIRTLPNYISITGHTDASGYSSGKEYTNWELSADRANASRRFMLSNKMERERVAKVVGMADHEPLLKNDPLSPRNRRISIILLRGAYLSTPSYGMPASRDLLSVPKANDSRSAAKPAEKPSEKPPAEAAKPEAGSGADGKTVIPRF